MTKLIATGAVVLLALFAVTSASSCSITHRSGDFECTDQACPSGRECVQGLCVVPGGGSGIDARVVVDAAHLDSGSGSGQHDAMDACPAACSSCQPSQKTCTIDCQQTSCAGPINCPTGWTCDIKCSTTGACRQGVTCTNAKACTVECTGNNSCSDVTCGAGACDVECSGSNACAAVDCETSCQCDVTCGDAAKCTTVTCTRALCETDSGCSSQNLGCRSCATTGT
jgi:hypothetical protein